MNLKRVDEHLDEKQAIYKALKTKTFLFWFFFFMQKTGADAPVWVTHK